MTNTNSNPKSLFILYGSEKGNAEYIAKNLQTTIDESNLYVSNQCMDLNSAKTKDLKNESFLTIIICSTTGNGDTPCNADAWWRSIKLRSVPKDKFSGMPFCVLGLGDTNYDKFCYMGKSIDKRLHELGGLRCIDLHCADEATTMEETIESWKDKLIHFLSTKPV